MTGWTLLVVLLLAIAGCKKPIRPAEWAELRIEPDPVEVRVVALQNKDAANLSADDVVRVLRKLELSDDRILELGPDLHNALGTAGAAEILVGKKSVVAFKVHGGYLAVRPASRSGFIYDLKRGQFGLMP
jgi:hypothetical protein